jgi:SAM-dependent methyltransferase
MIYAADLAYVHDAGFDDYARRAAPEIVRLLRHRLPRRQSKGRRLVVVEFGCGGGTLAGRLAGAGFDVLGVDQSRAMIQIARRRAPQARFAVGTLADTPLPQCDAIIAIGEVVNYLPAGTARAIQRHDRELSAFFARAAAALAPGGLLLFDFMAGSAGRTFPMKVRAGSDWAIAASARAAGKLLIREITTFRRVGAGYRRSHEQHFVRLYSQATITAALRRAGFAVAMRRRIGPVTLIRSDLFAIAVLQ